MPSAPYRYVQTGLSSHTGHNLYVVDTCVTPISVTVSAQVNSTNANFSIESTMDYTGSSAFISSNALWIQSSTTAHSSNVVYVYSSPVTAIRLNSTAGSSTGTIAVTIVQAG